MHHLTYINNLLHLGWRIYDSGTILFDSDALFIKKKKSKKTWTPEMPETCKISG